jgi:hypothetical protein
MPWPQSNRTLDPDTHLFETVRAPRDHLLGVEAKVEAEAAEIYMRIEPNKSKRKVTVASRESETRRNSLHRCHQWTTKELQHDKRLHKGTSSGSTRWHVDTREED